jgi:AraC-like DNA-binding protein
MRRLSRAATDQRLARIGLERARAASFAFVEDQEQLHYDAHTHSRHQLLYALQGSVRLEVQDARYVLPPQRVAFIPAGIEHVTIVPKVRIASVYLARRMVPDAPPDVRVLVVTPLLRELILYASHWPPERDPRDRVANAFFASFGLLLAQWLATPATGRLPRGKSREVRAALDYLGAHLADARLEEAARHAGTSARTLRRRIHEELGTSFRDLHAEARLLRAMELLPEHGVTQVAYALGYESLSAFSHRFARFAGELPSAYRARVRPRP